MQKLKNYYFIILILLISVLSLLFISCKQDPSTLRAYQLPEKINDGLEVGSLEEANIDQALIEKAINDINRGKYGEVHSMLIFRDSKLVAEEYFEGHKYQWDAPNHHTELVMFNKDALHSTMSDSKSITSICIGIAIDEGFIENVGQSIFDYLPEHQHLSKEGKEKITIENLLTMTSGLNWKEWNAPYSSPENDAIGIWFSDKDPISYILEKPLIYEPGTHFAYAGGDIITLGEILRHASGMDIEVFSEMYLFEPLGIDSFRWADRFENGVFECAGGLKLTPRSMVKIGVTLLNDGIWNGQRIISTQWVEKSAASFFSDEGIKVPGEDIGKAGYSYTWWTKEFSVARKKVNGFWANGWGGQKIMILPEINTVIVFTGGNYTSTVKNFKILEKYILPSID
jgi:CubicO group peptidase (beta-lactamase class C family)